MNYSLTLTEAEDKAFRWLADRGYSVDTLIDGAEIDYSDDHDAITYTFPEHVAWQYQDALKEENGNPDQILPTCAGGTLADKLLALWERIV